MSLADTVSAEIAGIATRLERRARRESDRDLEKAAALLRLMNEVITSDERRAAQGRTRSREAQLMLRISS